MSPSNDRPTSVLDRPASGQSGPYDGAPVVERPAVRGGPHQPVPRGWGSHEERRLVLWGVAGFFLLALYAVVFVLLGQLAWST